MTNGEKIIVGLLAAAVALLLISVTVALTSRPDRPQAQFTIQNPVDYFAACVAIGGHPGGPYECYR